MRFIRSFLVLGALLAFLAVPLAAAQAEANQNSPAGNTPVASSEGNDVVHVTVTVVGRHQQPPPTVHQDEVLVYQDQDRRQVVDWKPVANSPAGTDLAVVIDDGADTSLGIQLEDLRDFIRATPDTTRVGLFYARNGIVRVTQDFTTDHEAVAEKLRLPEGTYGAFASPYLSLVDLFKRWPDTGGRRAVLFVSDGIDLFRGIADSAPGWNMDLDQAIGRAQREGVVIYSIFADGVGRFHHNFFLVGNGQGCLSQLSYETGGEAFFQGFQTPVAFKPFLQQIQDMLGHQYLLAFRANLGTKGHYERLRVTTEVPGAELIAPDHVYIPAPKS